MSVLLHKLIVAHLPERFSAFRGTQRFIIIFTKACNWAQTQINSTKTTKLDYSVICCYHIKLKMIKLISLSSFLTYKMARRRVCIVDNRELNVLKLISLQQQMIIFSYMKVYNLMIISVLPKFVNYIRG
jgi:hypothetical protein